MDCGELLEVVTVPLRREGLPKSSDQRTTLTFTLGKDQHRAIEVLAWAMNEAEDYGQRVDMGHVVRLALQVVAHMITYPCEDSEVLSLGSVQCMIDSLYKADGMTPPPPKRRGKVKK